MSEQFTRSLTATGDPTAGQPGTNPTAVAIHSSPPLPEPAVAPPGYELLGEVGRGGMGVVYRARELALGRDVAVKLLQERYTADSPGVRRFVEEAHITSQLQHPGIPPLYQVGILPDGRPFLAMKLIKGRTLAELLADPQGDRGQLVAAFEQVCQAVGYAHAHKVIHRDLKPANVMVGSFGEVQVMDWGLAKVLRDSPAEPDDDSVDDSTLGTEILSARDPADATRAGSVLGTPAFMCREQAIGAVDQVDRRSDVFGLGAILCMILTGKPPYCGPSSESTRQLAAQAKLGDALVRLDACGAEPGLVALCKQCLSPEKSDRPADAGEVAQAVVGLRAAADERARQAELARTKAEAEAREQRKRRRVQLVLAAAVGLLLAGAGVAGWWADRQSTEKRDRLQRNADAVAGLLRQCVDSLHDDDAETAGLALDQAERRADEGGADHLKDRLAQCRSDLEMLRELNRIDDLRWDTVEGQFQGLDQAVKEWAQAFTRYGIDPGTTPADEAARRVNESLVKDQLMTALDRWLNWTRSQQLLGTLRVIDPDDVRCAVREAFVSRKAGRVRELVGGPAALRQPAWFAAVLGSSRSVPVAQREAILYAAVREQPGHFPLLMTLAGLYSGNPQKAAEREKWYRTALAVRPDNVVAWNNMGLALHDAMNLDGAAAAYQEALRLDPSYAKAHNNLGWVRLNQKKFGEAIPSLREAIRLDPSYAKAHNNLGLALRDSGKLDEAIIHFREAARLDPTYARAITNLGLALWEKGRRPEAIAAYREAIQADPTYGPAHNNLGHALRDTGDLHGAAAAYRQLTRLEPLYAPAHNSLGDILRSLKKPAEAIAAYRQAIKAAPRYALAHFNLGRILSDQGDHDGAIAAYRDAALANPEHALTRYNLGVTLWENGHPEAAVAAYREAIRLDPKYAPAHNGLGVALKSVRDLDGEIVALREALRLDPKFENAHNNLGNALREKGDLDGAIRSLREAIRLNPDYANAHHNLGLALRDRGDLDGAVAAIREAVRIDGRSSRIRFNLKDPLEKSGDLDGAIDSLRKAVRVVPKTPRYQANLRETERWRDLLPRLPDIAAGRSGPKSPAEAMEIAGLCAQPFQRRYVLASRLYEQALAANPKLAANGTVSWSAARAAALACAGKDAELTSFGIEEWGCFSSAAHVWLRAELASGIARTKDPKRWSSIRWIVTDWKRNPDLTAVRDPVWLAAMPEPDRHRWETFWTEVDVLQAAVSHPSPPVKKLEAQTQ